MEKQIAITKEAKEILTSKKHQLERLLEQDAENGILKNDIQELEGILNNSVEEQPDEAALVKIGSKVVVENLASGDKREYKIMTRLTANPLSGVISNESPLAQRILGLKLGNTFKFIEGANSEQTFKIKSID